MNKEEFGSAIAKINNSFAVSKNKIGAKNVVWKLLSKKLADISSKFEKGKPLSGIDLQEIKTVWLSEDPLIDENGNPFVLYIHDFSKNFWGEPNRVFHVAWCHTLEKMNKRGRRERYIKKTDLDNNDFAVDYGGGQKKANRLPACYNCRDKMQGIVSPNTLYYDRNNLDIARFFKIYGKQDLIDGDNPVYPVDYPKDWGQISRKKREESGWICNKCHKSFLNDNAGLDVHHKNGIKSDSRDINLVVLCRSCHTEQFGHEHMKNSKIHAW